MQMLECRIIMLTIIASVWAYDNLITIISSLSRPVWTKAV